MTEWMIAGASAFWLGLLTSISPCPLATNIAAVSFISKELKSIRRACWAGILYTCGRSFAYTALGALLAFSILSVTGTADFLQDKLNRIMGPVLILIGMLLLNLISFNLKGSTWLERAQQKVSRMGLPGTFLLGILFALSFCPLSAALFFGSLVPLSVKAASPVMAPLLYGIGTGLPVLLFALLIAFGLAQLGTAYNKIVAFEKYARVSTGLIFIAVGFYYSWLYIF